jgi:hypothetical protein
MFQQRRVVTVVPFGRGFGHCAVRPSPVSSCAWPCRPKNERRIWTFFSVCNLVKGIVIMGANRDSWWLSVVVFGLSFAVGTLVLPLIGIGQEQGIRACLPSIAGSCPNGCPGAGCPIAGANCNVTTPGQSMRQCLPATQGPCNNRICPGACAGSPMVACNCNGTDC